MVLFVRVKILFVLPFPDSVGNESKTLRGHSGPVYGACLIPDNKVLLSCSEDTTGKVL